MASVLVVDDDRKVRLLLRALLEREGHQVLEAADGAEGLAAARRDAVDLVLCDLFMPGLDGLETIRQLRRDFPAVPIVAMSGGGYGGRLDLLPAAGLLGAARLLRKPFTRDDLLAAVAHALEAPGGGANDLSGPDQGPHGRTRSAGADDRSAAGPSGLTPGSQP